LGCKPAGIFPMPAKSPAGAAGTILSTTSQKDYDASPSSR
jgi:hypothetical protein